MKPLSQQFRGILRLLASIGVVLIIWMGILPQVAQLEPVQTHLRQLENRNIDAGAMFYSELDQHLFPSQETLREILHQQSCP